MNHQKLTIKVAQPPIWEEAHKHFTIDDERTVYTYGDTLYNPGNTDVDIFLYTHEQTHQRQQAAVGGPEDWWRMYFADPNFRQDQELEAYREQYRLYCEHVHDREKRFRYRFQLGQFLSSKMYSAGITHNEACERIKKGISK